MFDFPIDIVYLWVNSEDENWQKKKEIEAKKLGIDTKNDICRYKDNDELKYSLRSLEKYASWINKIYLVVDNQIPSWLNLENPKIKIINHDEIIPKSCLPTFNSCAIEHCIVNIKGLSEHFLYSNDDTFFADFVEPTFFYAQDGKPFFRYRGYHPEIPTSQYQKMMCSAKNLLNKRYSNISNLMPHHNIDAYCKRDIL